MEIKKDKKLTHLLFSSSTIGFSLGGLAYFISETNKEFHFVFLIESPIIY